MKNNVGLNNLTLEEKLIKLNSECPLIPHTNSSRLFSTVRRMTAEKEMEIPINFRSGFAVSVVTGKHANEMDEWKWESFYLELIRQLKSDYPELHQKIFKIPEGLTKCKVCGEYKGEVKAKYLNWYDPSGVDPNKIISVSCLCNGIICPKCHITKMHRPISNEYDEETNSISHSPWFMGQAGCDKCRNKK